MDPVDKTALVSVAPYIAQQAVFGGRHASPMLVPYEDSDTGGTPRPVAVHVLKITQDPPAMLLRGELRISWLASVCFAAAHF